MVCFFRVLKMQINFIDIFIQKCTNMNIERKLLNSTYVGMGLVPYLWRQKVIISLFILFNAEYLVS